MEIIKNTIIDLSNQFLELKKRLDRSDYTVYFDIKKFKFKENLNFEIKDLQMIFDSKEIKGEIKKETFENAKLEIKSCLGCNILQDTNISTEQEKREALFWNSVNKNFNLPPKITYEHIPKPGSFFGSFLIWGFCYIMLNKFEGFIIAGDTSD